MKLLIVGASARAAAQSATRASYQVVAADLFGDRDLREIADCHVVANYPDDLRTVRQQIPELPLLYTGALENYPQLVADMAAIGPCWGNSAETLRRLRNPRHLATAFAEHDIPYPETRLLNDAPGEKRCWEHDHPAKKHSSAIHRQQDPFGDVVLPEVDRTGEWLWKPVRSAGGAHIRLWDGNAAADEKATGPNSGSEGSREEGLLQRRVSGQPVSAAFVAYPDQPPELLGMSRMLVGGGWGGPSEFAYCGSVAEQLSASAVDRWSRIARCLIEHFELRGLFGVDAIETTAGLVPIEVNPRYTASMEVIEPSLPVPIMAFHVAAFHEGTRTSLRRRAANLAPTTNFCPSAKWIVYARHDLTFPRTLPTVDGIRWADVPAAGQRISAGSPIFTILGRDTLNFRSALATLWPEHVLPSQLASLDFH